MPLRELDFSGTIFSKLKDIPSSIRFLAWARAIRWIGWGFGENLLPIFILSFTTSLTAAGLVSASYDLVFLIVLPLVGLLADIVPSKALLVAGLAIYPFIGLSYWLAGATGLITFIILARMLNGVSYCLDSIGVDTYMRRVSPNNLVASSFGYTASIANFAWVLAALAGVYLVRFVSISTLLFLVTPFSILAFIPLLKVARDTPPARPTLSSRAILAPLTTFLKEVIALQKGMRGVVFLMFMLDTANVAATFFIPINAYKSGASLSAVALLTVIGAAPSISEFWLAEFIDGNESKRRLALTLGLLALPFLFVGAALATTLVARIVVALGIETASIFGSLALQSYATALSRRDRYGEVSSVLEGATTLGDLTGPIAIGVLTDAVGFSSAFALLSALFLFIALHFLRRPIAARASSIPLDPLPTRAQ